MSIEKQWVKSKKTMKFSKMMGTTIGNNKILLDILLLYFSYNCELANKKEQMSKTLTFLIIALFATGIIEIC